jgi:hypothetical protein
VMESSLMASLSSSESGITDSSLLNEKLHFWANRTDCIRFVCKRQGLTLRTFRAARMATFCHISQPGDMAINPTR